MAGVALADNAPYRPAYQPSYKQPAYDEPAEYQYAYAVKDEYKGVDFGANEDRKGYNTNGAYNVLLPDGRTQTVTYTVNEYDGYVADVQYEGEARYDEPKYQPKYEPKYQPYQPRYEPKYEA